jgi:ribosomal protein S18 acetylase RimI-like enzyme
MGVKECDEPGTLETDAVLVRTMRKDDLPAVVAIDAATTGRQRPHYFEVMMQRAVQLAGLQISLVAELAGEPAGFLIGSLFYGEYGVTEPSASIDAISVSPKFRGRHIGKALLRQFRLNLSALQITSLRTEVSWDDFELLAFFKKQGFAPAGRLCLECTLDPTVPEA